MPSLPEIYASLPTRSYAKGEIIFEQGGTDDEILFLKSGKVEIQVDGSTITTVSNAGAMLGEVAVLLDRKHSATAIALEDCEFHVLENAEASLSDYPAIVREISTVLARRLVRASETAADLTKHVEIDQELRDFDLTLLWDEDEI